MPFIASKIKRRSIKECIKEKRERGLLTCQSQNFSAPSLDRFLIWMLYVPMSFELYSLIVYYESGIVLPLLPIPTKQNIFVFFIKLSKLLQRFISCY